MKEFFEFVEEIFSMIWEFISNIVNGFSTAFAVLSKAITLPPILTGFVPSVISTCIIGITAIGVFKLILGWGNK